MLTKPLSLNAVVRAGGIALVAAVAIGAAQPTTAVAASANASAISQSSTAVPTHVTPTDVSAARRQRHARRSTPRDAYGSYVGGAGGVTTQSYPGYGYGVGDNSRGQTW